MISVNSNIALATTSGTSFLRNTAPSGGAAAFVGSTARVSLGGNFAGNAATKGNGGLLALRNVVAYVNVTSGTISNNVAQAGR